MQAVALSQPKEQPTSPLPPLQISDLLLFHFCLRYGTFPFESLFKVLARVKQPLPAHGAGGMPRRLPATESARVAGASAGRGCAVGRVGGPKTMATGAGKAGARRFTVQK